MEHFLRYFCGDAANPQALADTEPLRISFYKSVATFVRAYADIAQNLPEAGYSEAAELALKKEVDFYTETRAQMKKHSGEELDVKPFEADMRHLLNTYIQADPAVDQGNLDSLSLTELVIHSGIHDAIARKLNAKGKLSKDAIAEGIINNVRKTLIRHQLTDPRLYAEMSALLEDLIKQNRAEAAAYQAFLQQAEELVRRMAQKDAVAGVPAVLHGQPEAILLFKNLPQLLAEGATVLGDGEPLTLEARAALALRIDQAVREQAPAGWKGDETRERAVQNARFPLLARNRRATEALFDFIKQQQGY